MLYEYTYIYKCMYICISYPYLSESTVIATQNHAVGMVVLSECSETKNIELSCCEAAARRLTPAQHDRQSIVSYCCPKSRRSSEIEETQKSLIPTDISAWKFHFRRWGAIWEPAMQVCNFRGIPWNARGHP